MKRYQYNWASCDEPAKLSNKILMDKFDLYRFVDTYGQGQDHNELLDKLQDLHDEMVRRGLIK